MIVPIVIVFVLLSIMAGASFAFWYFLIRVPEGGPAPAPESAPPPLGDYYITSPSPETPSPYDAPAGPSPSPEAAGPSPYGAPAPVGPSPYYDAPAPLAVPAPGPKAFSKWNPLTCLADETVGSYTYKTFSGEDVDRGSEHHGTVSSTGECCDIARKKGARGYEFNRSTGDCRSKNLSVNAMGKAVVNEYSYPVMSVSFDTRGLYAGEYQE
jgi:hypothetical protein